jgi:hypothetical protein
MSRRPCRDASGQTGGPTVAPPGLRISGGGRARRGGRWSGGSLRSPLAIDEGPSGADENCRENICGSCGQGRHAPAAERPAFIARGDRREPLDSGGTRVRAPGVRGALEGRPWVRRCGGMARFGGQRSPRPGLHLESATKRGRGRHGPGVPVGHPWLFTTAPPGPTRIAGAMRTRGSLRSHLAVDDGPCRAGGTLGVSLLRCAGGGWRGDDGGEAAERHDLAGRARRAIVG